MNCAHCTPIRARQAAMLAEHATDLYPGLYCRSGAASDAMSAAVLSERYPDTSGVPLAGCPCECHAPARMVGKFK